MFSEPPVRPCQPCLPGKGEFPLGWPRESPAAVRLCLAYCPLLDQCRRQVLTLPSQSEGIVAGLTQAERQELARPAALKLERRREVSRASERRRRMLGLAAQYQRDRYAQDPEPQRQAMRGYYARNAEAIKAKRLAHYAANREDILAARRAARRAG
jgi:Transcription factor WhiB